MTRTIEQILGLTPMNQSDLIASPMGTDFVVGIEEGFCNAVIEAQAMELPVVTSDAGGLPENVEDGVTGFVVPRRNPAALADKLALLARDPALRRRLGCAGRARATARFDLDRQAEASCACIASC